MKYKGYTGIATFDPEGLIFHGEVIGLKDVITFQGTSVDELIKAFQDSIDEYIDWCKDRNEEPEKTYSGNIRLRMPSALHAHLAKEAAKQKKSLNDFILQHLKKC